jgi:L-serine dehydratase
MDLLLTQANAQNQSNSILNYVIGPIMRGPSSSHTAASYFIGLLAGRLVNHQFQKINVHFNTGSSWSQVYHVQNSELGFMSGFLNQNWLNESISHIKEIIKTRKIEINFLSKPLKDADHPNFVEIEIYPSGLDPLIICGKSIGGGKILITKINNWQVNITGEHHTVLIKYDKQKHSTIIPIIKKFVGSSDIVSQVNENGKFSIQISTKNPINQDFNDELEKIKAKIWYASPIFYVIRGEPLFQTAEQMVFLANQGSLTLGEIALQYEAQLLKMSPEKIMEAVEKRVSVMLASVKAGLEGKNSKMNLLQHSASILNKNEKERNLFGNNFNTRSAIRALAAMDVVSSGGVICAAPTGGSAGVLPGVLYTLQKDFNIGIEKLCLCTLAAGAIGLINSNRSTFAAEIAGCQVEIGMAGAMACAAVIEAANGLPQDAANAAAIALQNTMGSVCDLVAGMCEIPCHTRNATAASNAFVCADLILGGYINPIPLDETIDASFETGKMLPVELRCTALGGIAITPTAKTLYKDEDKN